MVVGWWGGGVVVVVGWWGGGWKQEASKPCSPILSALVGVLNILQNKKPANHAEKKQPHFVSASCRAPHPGGVVRWWWVVGGGGWWGVVGGGGGGGGGGGVVGGGVVVVERCGAWLVRCLCVGCVDCGLMDGGVVPAMIYDCFMNCEDLDL